MRLAAKMDIGKGNTREMQRKGEKPAVSRGKDVSPRLGGDSECDRDSREGGAGTQSETKSNVSQSVIHHIFLWA